MDFTGERYIPNNENVDQELGIEHLNRYFSVLPFVTGKKVLDAACGVGYGSKILADQATHVTGVDIDEATITYAKEYYQSENIEYLVNDIEKISAEAEVFDVAISFETLEHLSKKKQDNFLHEIKRVLKKNGILIISTPDKKNYSEEFNFHNKFHKNEFHHDEFVRFLQSRYKHVELYYQSFEVCNLLTHNKSHSLKLLHRTSVEVHNGKYMVAVCSDSPWPQINFSSLQIFSGEYGRRTRRILQLQDEVEERNRWAADLNEEITILRNLVNSQQLALALHTAEVAERTATVKSQHAEAEKARDYLTLLKAELEKAKKEHVLSVEAFRQELAQQTAEVAELNATVQRHVAEANKMDKRAIKQLAALDQAKLREEELLVQLSEAKFSAEDTLIQSKSDKLRIENLENIQQQMHQDHSQLTKIHRSAMLKIDDLKEQFNRVNHKMKESESRVVSQQQMLDQQNVQLEKTNKILKKVSKRSEQKTILASNVESLHHLRRKYQDQLYADLFTFKGYRDVLRINKILKAIKVRKAEYNRLFDRLPRRFVESFDSGKYLNANPDVAAAIVKGDFENALEHFVFFGYPEVSQGNRRLYEKSGYFDEAKYLDANHDVRKALEKEDFRSAFEHYLMFGCFEIISGERKGSDADTAFRDRLHIFDPESVYLSQAMALTAPSFIQPTVSIIIPAYNQANYTFACIESIIANTKSTPYEIIVADDSSPDIDAQNIKHLVRNISFVKNEENLGFLLNCNKAAERARGKYIMFLNNDTNVQPGWLSALVELLDSDEKIGMAGSKLVYPDGRLQEAGGIVWDDASGWNFGRLDDPAKPEYNYAKDVDYLSGAAMMVRKELWQKLGGFDVRYVPAYYEDTDLAFEIRNLGYRVVYQPQSVVVHFEGVSHGTDTAYGIKHSQIENKEKFLKKWKPVLEKDHFKNGENVFLARDKSKSKKRLLYIDHYLPHYDQDAGSKATYLYLKALAKSGFQVYFIGDNYWHYPGLPYLKALNDLGVEVLWGDHYAKNWKNWLTENGQWLDIVVLSRPHISAKYIDEVKNKTNAKIIYLGHDLHFLREEREYTINKDENVLKSAHKWKEIELSLMKKADVSWFFSDVEKKVVADIDPQINVQIVPLYVFEEFLEPKTNKNKTKDIVFVGGFGHKPNVDAVLWFVKKILSRIHSALPDLKFYIVGSNPPDEIKSLSSDKIVVTGFVSDQKLTEYLNDCRLMVAPLRFGAGVKGKIIDAMYAGIPVVTTTVGAEGLIDSADAIVVADEAKDFADKVINVYRDSQVCEKLSENSSKYCRKMFSVDRVKDIFHKL